MDRSKKARAGSRPEPAVLPNQHTAPAAVSEKVLPKIGPIVGDGVHDTDLMLWFTGARIDERMEIVGTEGSMHIQDGAPNFSVCDKDGWRAPGRFARN